MAAPMQLVKTFGKLDSCATFAVIRKLFCNLTYRKFHTIVKALQYGKKGGCQPVALSQSLGQCRTRAFSTVCARAVLGIETSCDDTGVAIMDENGKVLGEALYSQTKTHLEFGGIIPTVARDLHQNKIEEMVKLTFQEANMTISDLDAVAVTVKPGMALSLGVGLLYAKKLTTKSQKPLIPIHHMEAHALTARMLERVSFPFLVLLVSGGHCLLAIVRDIDDFILIGKGIDDSPGEAFDKIARRLGLKNLPECENLHGGAAIELLATRGKHQAFHVTEPLLKMRNCNFSFGGMKAQVKRIIEEEEKIHSTGPGAVLPNVSDICASFQYAVCQHLAKRLQRGLLFCEMKDLLPENKTLVISGGVASNMFIRKSLENVCEYFNCRVVCPPPKLCTDNGIMIAWNGIEKLKAGKGLLQPTEIRDLMYTPKCPLGTDWTSQVEQCSIKIPKATKRTIANASKTSFNN